MEPSNDLAGAVKTLAGLIARHNVRAIAIGNGTASRETAAFVQDFLRQANLAKVFSVMVNESGASVYSASDIARQEFPDLDLTDSRRHLHRAAVAGPAGGTGEDRSQVDRRGAVPARCGPAAS